MARAAVLAAGGIVLRQAETPEIAVVRLRKRNEWVLPKGKLDDGETARDAAEREVLEETGHEVSVHEFLGTLVYESGGRCKVVHYWRMETSGEQAYELMDDVRAVDWLPLDAAVDRLSRGYERAFLENVGPLALEAAALARIARPVKAKKPPVAEKRRRRPVVAPPAAPAAPMPTLPQPDLAPSAGEPEQGSSIGKDIIAVEAPVCSAAPVTVALPVQEIQAVPEAAPAAEAQFDRVPVAAALRRRTTLVQKVRDWLRRAA